MAETGKQRSIRIPLDYYKRWDAIQKGKVGLAAVAGVLALAWWASGFVTKDKGQVKYERGPVAEVHKDKPGDDNCTACHVPFSPISAQRGPATLIGNIHTSDAKCEECHPGPGKHMGAHHTSQKEADTTNCGGCHRDHLGREKSLVWLADSDCASCHKNLKEHMTGDASFNQGVTRFDAEHHPEFHLFDKLRNMPNVGKDPGRLKFSHAVHMAPGLLIGGDGKSGFTYARLDEAAKESGLNSPDLGRYGFKSGDKNQVVKLDCRACHVPLGAEASQKLLDAGPSLAKRMDGAYMVPITYDNQCQVCHPITDHLGTPLKHGQTPQHLDKELKAKYAEVKAEPKAADVSPRRVPGDRLTGAVETGLNVELRKAEQYLYAGRTNCGECHYFKRKESEVVPEAIEPPKVPTRWFEHALFNHAKHTDVNCQDCHKVYGSNVTADASTTNTDVLIPDSQNCRQCHAPPSGRDKAHTARLDCTECHRYHTTYTAGAQSAGLGAWAKAPD